MAKSDFILGRRACRAAFRAGKQFTLSAYVYHNYGKAHMRYTDPVIHPPKPTSRISYRIRVTPKGAPRNENNQ